jgi:MSHA biogenesis protein MshK
MKSLSPLLLAGILLHPGTALADPSVRDPMRPPQAANQRATVRGPVAPAVPRVTALFLSGDSRTAVVDGKVVRAGDTVSGVLIEAVLEDGIRYRRGAQSLVARISRVVPRVASPRAGEGS